ncbi:hypothetical protein CSB37_00425 [bacterium DOLZORAL124_38_8]|nr:MAG: hypothetical protein CSB37_00425 [bacterium DOLZORAL124_38_8]
MSFEAGLTEEEQTAIDEAKSLVDANKRVLDWDKYMRMENILNGLDAEALGYICSGEFLDLSPEVQKQIREFKELYDKVFDIKRRAKDL